MCSDEILQKLSYMENVIKNLQSELSDTKLLLNEVLAKRNELYYQKFLEKQLSATHKKTKFGITDISNETHHIEIKHWINYKSALGQLLSYNFNDNKSLAAYFFGSVSEHQKQDIITLFHTNNVSVHELIDTPTGIQIINHHLCHSETQEQQFENWLSNKIYFSENSYMTLDEICSSFFKSKVVSHDLISKYKNIIETYIKKNIKEINSKYNAIHKGWCHLTFYNNEDPFIKWLDENIEYNENKVLKLGDVCELYLGKTKIHSSSKTKYKNILEKYIKFKFLTVKWKYSVININGISYNGWKHLCIKRIL
jgi:hypothetical protein